MILRIAKLRLRYYRRRFWAALGFCPECGYDLVYDSQHIHLGKPRGWCPKCETVKP